MRSVRYGALFLDAGGTLLQLQEPVGETYARIARGYGVTRSPEAIDRSFRRAMRAPWQGRRYDGDGRPFWRFVVERATGSDHPELFEALYQAFGPSAWQVAPGALRCIETVRGAGVKVAVVSNWDHRLRSLLAATGILERIDAAIVSGEVMLEKPDPRIFARAARQVGVPLPYVVHVGDSRKNDVVGARSAGCAAWQLGQDVTTFDEIARRILEENGGGGGA